MSVSHLIASEPAKEVQGPQPAPMLPIAAANLSRWPRQGLLRGQRAWSAHWMHDRGVLTSYLDLRTSLLPTVQPLREEEDLQRIPICPTLGKDLKSFTC